MDPVLEQLVEPFERMPPAEASRILTEHYGVPAAELESLPTERDDSFLVSAGGQQFSLKVAHPSDDPAVIEMQLAAMTFAAIIRFRTRIDDPRDVLFLFAALSTGLAIGVYGFTISFVVSILFCLLAVYCICRPSRALRITVIYFLRLLILIFCRKW